MGSAPEPDKETHMRAIKTEANPFMMMMNPEVILQAVERSERLNRLQRHVCRPLDKPLIPKVNQAGLADYDREIDLAEEVADEGEAAAI